MLDGDLTSSIGSSIASGMGSWTGFLKDLESSSIFDYTVPLIINVDNPAAPRPPTLNDMLSHYVDTDNDGKFGPSDGEFTDPQGLVLFNLDNTFGKADNYVTWDEVFQSKIGDRISAYLTNPSNFSGDAEDNAEAFTNFLNVNLSDNSDPLDSITDNLPVPGFSVSAFASYRHQDVSLSGSTMTPGQIAWSLTVLINRMQDYDIDLGRNAELFGLTIDDNDAIRATAQMRIGFTFGVETRRDVITDTKGTEDPDDDTYSLGDTTIGGFFIDTSTPHGGLYVPGLEISTDFEFVPNTPNTTGKLTGQFGFLDVTFDDSTLEFDASIKTNLVDPGVSSSVTKSGRLDTANLGAGVETLVPESSITRDGSLTGELKIYIDRIDDGILGPDPSLFVPDPGSGPYATLLITAPGGDVFSPAMVPDGSSDARPAPVIAPKAGDEAKIEELSQFNNIGPQAIVGFLNQLSGALQSIQSSSLFTTEIPFSDGTTIGSILNLQETLQRKLLVDGNIPKLINKEGQVTFGSAQGLAKRLADLLGVPVANIQAKYDPATDELTYTVNFDLNLPEVDKAIDFDLGVGNIAGVKTDAVLTLGVKNTLSFTFGANLKSLAPLTLNPSARDQAIVALLKSDGTAYTPADGNLTTAVNFSLNFGSKGSVEVSLPIFDHGSQDNLRLALQTAINLKTSATLLPAVTVNLVDGRLEIAANTGDSIRLRPVAAADGAVTELGFAWNNGVGQTSSVVPVPANGVLPGDAVFSLRADGTTKVVTLTGASTQNGNTSLADLAVDLQAAIDAQFGAGKVNVKIAGSILALTSTEFSILQILSPNAVAVHDLGFTDQLVASKVYIPGVRELVLTATTAKNTNAFDGVLSGDASFNVSINGGSNVAVNVLRVPTIDVTGLGFAPGQTSAGATLTAANEGPGAGRLAGDITFQISLDGGAGTNVTVQRASTVGANLNYSVADLASDLQAAITAAGAPLAGLTASVSNNRLVLSKTGATAIKVESVSVANASGTADNGVTPASTGLDRLIGDLNAALAATAYNGGTLADWLFVAKQPNTETPSETDYFLTLAARPGQPVDALAVTGGNAAFQETGFSAAFSGDVSGPRTNGQVSNTATFLIAVNGAASVPITIAPAETSGFASIGQLATLIQGKIDATALNGKILVTVAENRLLFSGLDPTLRLVRVTPERLGDGALTPAGMAAENQLGIRETLVRVPESGARFFVENLGLDSTIDADATAIAAKAFLGFVGIETSGGNVNVQGAVSVDLKRDSDSTTRFTIGDLLTAISTGKVGDITTTPSFTWSGSAVLDNIKLDTDLPVFSDLATAIAGTNRLAFKFDAAGTAIEVDYTPVTGTSLGALEDFAKLKFDSVLGGLKAIVTFLKQLESIAAFDTKIPVLNLSFNDLVGAADRFQKVVDDFQKNPTLAVQSLQARLREALGLPASSPLVALGFDATNKILGLKFTLSEGFDKGVGIDLDLQNLAAAAGVTIPGDILNLRGSARLDTAGSVDVVFNFGIDLAKINAAPTAPLDAMFLVVGNGPDATKAIGSFKATGTDMAFNGAIGPIGLFVNDGTVTIDSDGDATTAAPLTLGVALSDADGGNDNRLYLSNFGTALGTAFTPVFQGGIGARLPVFFPTESFYLGDIEVGVADIAEFLDGAGDGNNGGVSFAIPDLSNFAAGNFSLLDNLRMIVEGVDVVLNGLQSVLSGEIFGFSLPLVGDKLGDAATFIQDLRTNIINKVKQALNDAPEQAVQVVTNALTSALGATGLNVLRGAITTTGNPAAPTGSFIQWNVPLGTTIANVDAPIGFDLGLPGLGLEADGDLKIKLDWTFDFAFGLDLENGFYLDVSDTTPTGALAGFDPGKLNLGFEISLPDASLTGKLLFLKLVLADDGPDDEANNTTKFELDFTVDLVRSGGGDKLGLFEPQNLDIEWDVTGNALVDLDLTLTLNNNDLGVPNGVFPGLVADFVAQWTFDKDNISAGGNLTQLKFMNIGLDLGSFISDFLGPIVKEVQKVTKPFEPLVEVITTPIPVLSDLAGKPITLIDLAELYGKVDAGFIYAIADIISLVNSLPTDAGNVIITFFDTIDLKGDQTDPLNDFSLANLKSPAALDAKRSTGTANDFISSIPSLSSAKQAFANAGGFANKLNSSTASSGTKSFTQKLTTGGLGTGFSFPLLDDPTQLLGLLFGFNKDLVLFEYDMAPLKFEFEYSQFFPIWGPLGASITGTVALDIDFAFGFDTFGIRKFAEGGYEYPLDIFRGFYVKDTVDGTGSGAEMPEITFLLQLVGAAEINLGIASGGVGGGLRSTTYFDLNDPNKDGRVRIEELLNNFFLGFTDDFPVGPLSLFDVSGKLEAFLTAYIEFLFVEFETQIGPSIPILEYTLPLDRPPVLATEIGNGVLRLNMGPYAADRLHRNTADGKEHFTVTHVSGEAGNETVTVSSIFNGTTTTQTYSGVKRIIADGGLEDDVIEIKGGVKSPMELSGGAGDDRIELFGTGPATILGGTGDDTLIGGSSADSIDGGAGNDSIRGGGGNDTIRGGEGNDTILGEDGNDVIYGDQGDDSIEGGNGTDFIDGGTGNDLLKGGADNDTITGGFGRDTIQGDGGNDMLAGGADSDVINGNDGNDTLWGDSSFTRNGAGTVDRTEPLAGSEGNDTIFGDAGNDSIFGERGGDFIRGGTGADWVDGGEGADTIYGDEGNDTLLGGLDGDVIFGNGGADSIEGGAGNDILFGDNGEVDRGLSGSSGPDGVANYDGDPITIDRLRTVANPLPGGGDAANFDGNDIVNGGAGDDIAFGGGGNDKLFGDVDVLGITPATNYTGNDLLVGDYAQVDFRYRRVTRILSSDTGLGGDDTIHGNNGNDTVIGGAGKDTLHGGHTSSTATSSPTDHDIIIGDSGELRYADLVNGNIVNADKVSPRHLTLARSIAPTQGDIDNIFGQEGDDVIIGGAGGDNIDGSTGQVVALGDNGEIEFAGGKLKRIETTDTTNATGGSDTITGKNVSDILVGGVLGDLISGNAGDDILIGDNVRIEFLAGVITKIETKDFLLGGNDTVSGSAGHDTAIGGSFDDSIAGAAGDDVLIGDNARMTFAGGKISKIETTDAAGDTTPNGRDTITGDEGSDTLLGGADADTIQGNTGNDVILGDNGTLEYQLTQTGPVIAKIFTGTPDFGGADTIEGNAGSDILLGGAVNDSIKGNDSADVLPVEATDDDTIFGDGGELIYNGGTLQSLRSTHTGVGGSDTILGNQGSDIILGGAEGDLIYGNAATDTLPAGVSDNDIIFGDSGELIYNGGPIREMRSLDAGIGGNDTIVGNRGNDTILGGAAADHIHGNAASDTLTGAGTDDDVIFGDSGELIYNGGPIREMRSLAAGIGGNDTIIGNRGSDTILGGAADDSITGNATGATLPDSSTDDDIIVGDSGELIYNGGPLRELRSIATDIGGSDTIAGNQGADTIIGGQAGDVIAGNEGRDVLLGDNGELLWVLTSPVTVTAPDGWSRVLADTADAVALLVIRTYAPQHGGNDAITGDGDNDTILGGTGADTISGDSGTTDNGGTGNDIIFGDHGVLYPTLPTNRNFFSKDTGKDAHNGMVSADRIYGNGGDDTVIGGQDDDTILGGDGNDIIVGGHNIESNRRVEPLPNLPGGALTQDTAAIVTGSSDTGDYLDGGRGFDVIAGDNAWIIPVAANDPESAAYSTDRLFRSLNSDGLLYDDPVDGLFAANITSVANPEPGKPGALSARAVFLLDHTKTTDVDRFGADLIAGGADNDTIFGQLGDDSLHGDGRLSGGDFTQLVNSASPDGTPTALDKDGNDYVEGNGGSDTIFGGRGQDNIIGGSSDMFGLAGPSVLADSTALRPDSSDLIFGGNNTETGLNDYGDASALPGDVFLKDDENVADNGHSRDADVILGDNGRVFRILTGNTYASFAHDGGLLATGGNKQPANASTLGYNNPSGYGTEKIQVRAFELIDYTPGVGGVGGNFGNDRIFGEAGDDTIHGMAGSDSLFGDGQDDDLYGGTGHDWIHGGTGEDGVIGDDGLIKTSRNGLSNAQGLAEPLYGIPAIPAGELNLFIKTPGGIQQSHINIVNQLHKTVDLEPFALETTGDVPATGLVARPVADSDDVIFGGLGNDSLHGGAGDDAISGAEALEDVYNLAKAGTANLNPGNLLKFGAYDPQGDPQEFSLYDEYNPLAKIATGFELNGATTYQHLLNFVTKKGDGSIINDGRDKLFGDLGNDWLVGGTNRDNLYGGFGNDLLDTDDDKETASGANNVPDERTDFFYADIAFGGGGRDVLIANTGKDRIIDWVGEFNSYLVPFAPYGAWTISRTLQPQLPEYLYALSKSDGADQTRATAQTFDVTFPGGDAARNGEPYGELGLVKQQDDFWKAQTGAPDDPQAGNIPGGTRDEWKSESFSSANQTSFAAESAAWSVKSGTYQITATNGYDATSVMFVENTLPTYFEIQTTINTDRPRAGIKANGAIIFDYKSETDFKFAGIDVSTNKLMIGQRTAGGWQVLASANQQLSGERDYTVKLFVNRNVATVQLNGTLMTSYTFATKLNEGLVGLGSDNSTSRFDNVKLMVLPPNLTAEVKEDFNDGVADFFNQTLGSWQSTGGAYIGTPDLGSNFAVSTMGLAMTPGLATDVSAQLTIAAGTLSGFVFDYQSATNFKYAGYDAATKKLVIGHRTATGWYLDASFNINLAVGSTQALSMTIENSVVNLSLNGVKQLSYRFNGFVDDGQLGLLTKGGPAKFDNVSGKTLQR